MACVNVLKGRGILEGGDLSDTTEELPPWLDFLVYSYTTAHEFTTAQLRRKLSVNTSIEALQAEADEMVRRDIGSFPSEARDPYSTPEEEAELERNMRSIAARNFDSLQETESYMWGLGIAGLFHQWERDTRQAVKHYHPSPITDLQLNRLKFDDLCAKVDETEFAITRHPAYPELRLAYLISNTIKHGDGPAFRELSASHPELFPKRKDSEGVASKARPFHLRVGANEYDKVAEGIRQIWMAYDSADVRARRK